MIVTPTCDACGSAFLAWQLEPRCLLWRCPRCGHIRRDLDLSPAGARSEVYGGDPAADRVRLAITHRRIRARLPLESASDILEIGAGSGALLERFARDGAHVRGVDPVSSHSDLLHLDLSTAEQMDVADASFDLVLAIHVLEHVEDVHQALARIFRALRPGGWFYALTPNASSSGLRVFGASWWMLEDPTHRRFLSPESATRLLGAPGFQQIRTRPVRLDSLGVEGASAARMVSRSGTSGVLAHRPGKVAALACAPVGLAARAVWPRFSPTLEIVGRRPQAST